MVWQQKSKNPNIVKNNPVQLTLYFNQHEVRMAFDINQLMKQAQEMQKQLMNSQKARINKEFCGSSAGGKVKSTLKIDEEINYKFTKLEIDPEFITGQEKEVLEDLIIAAFNDAIRKAEEDMKSSQPDFSSMLPPGFKMPF